MVSITTSPGRKAQGPVWSRSIRSKYNGNYKQTAKQNELSCNLDGENKSVEGKVVEGIVMGITLIIWLKLF